MKKLALLSISASALAAASGMAMAADMAVKYTPPPPKPCCDTWAGIYFGAYFGSGAGRATQDFTETSTSTNTFIDATPPLVNQFSTSNTTSAGSSSGDITGSVVNLVVGGNWQPDPRVVLGLQVEGTVFSDITLKTVGTQSSTSVNNSFNVTVPGGVVTVLPQTSNSNTSTYEYHDELRSMFTFIGRAGGLVTPDLLIYGLGGGVLGNFVVPDGITGEDTFGGKRSIWKLGYTVGAGGEYRINKNWFLRGEYRFIHFKIDRDNSSSSTSTFISSGSTSTSTNSSTRSQSTDFNFHLGTVGIVYKFCPWCN